MTLAAETIDNGSMKYLHHGTGIYGPHGRPIVIEPKGKKALRWPGAKHPVKSVTQRGIEPLDFLRLAHGLTQMNSISEKGGLKDLLNPR